ncbi:hypothetical protein PG275_01035 [Riemerella anatipestifer]|uniref:lipopolysaccharide biosynthesis protein n=1 Tax=Riemerella anatipestifer TaxID=34085 RepID=UPI002A8862D6|nr:hypothetical protein [Riemerella anatipestifer]
MIFRIFKNKVFIYLITRYFTYFLQFISSILIAVKLGPHYFGIWGFILLIINYYRIADFGISSATNILMIQNKENTTKISEIFSNSLFLVACLSCVIIILMIIYYFFGQYWFTKYSLGSYFYIVSTIGIIVNFNILFMTIYRFRNDLFYLSFYQSIIPLLVLTFTLIFKEEDLLKYLVYAYLFGNIVALLLFKFGKKLPHISKIDSLGSKQILYKGINLFVYNVCFYLIVISIRTLVSIYYSVKDFGLFSFSFSLANSVLLFLQALSFVIFPKVVDKLKDKDFEKIKTTIDDIRNGYVGLAYLLIFIAISLYPIFISFLPQYQKAYISLGLVSLTVVIYTNTFGYSSFLMAQNREKLIAKISFLSLIMNVALGILFIKIFHFSFDRVILATTITYFVYTQLCVYFGKKIMGLKESFWSDMNDCFPARLFIPYLIALVLIISDVNRYLMVVPLIIYLILNKKVLLIIYNKIQLLIHKPDVINLK